MPMVFPRNLKRGEFDVIVTSFILKTDHIYAFITRWVLIFLMTSIPIICGMDVFFRYVLKAPLHGSDEILIFLQIWLYFIGFASAARERSHIVARVIEPLLKKNEYIAFLRMIVAFIGTIIASYFVYMGFDYFTYALRVFKTTAILNYPMFWYESAPFICFIPLLIYTFIEFCYYLKRIRHSDVNFIGQDEEIEAILKEIDVSQNKDEQKREGGV